MNWATVSSLIGRWRPKASPRRINLDRLRDLISSLEHTEQFGGLYRTAFTWLYGIARDLVVSILNDHHDIQTSRPDEELFATATQLYPAFSKQLEQLLTLKAFGSPAREDPFDPRGDAGRDEFDRFRGLVGELWWLAYLVRRDRETASTDRAGDPR